MGLAVFAVIAVLLAVVDAPKNAWAGRLPTPKFRGVHGQRATQDKARLRRDVVGRRRPTPLSRQGRLKLLNHLRSQRIAARERRSSAEGQTHGSSSAAVPKSASPWERTKAAMGRGMKRLSRSPLAQSALGQFAAGLMVDGPRDSWHAIRSNPKVFAYGLLATGGVSVLGGLAGWPMHGVLVGASAVAAGLEVWQIRQHEYDHLKGHERYRVWGKMAWLPILVVATALAGGVVEGHSAPGALGVTAAAARLSLGSAVESFSAGIVTGGDVPTSALTAYQEWHAGQRAKRRPRRKALR